MVLPVSSFLVNIGDHLGKQDFGVRSSLLRDLKLDFRAFVTKPVYLRGFALEHLISSIINYNK